MVTGQGAVGCTLPIPSLPRLLVGSSVRGPASLPESNRPVGSLNRLVSVLSARSPSPLTSRVQSVSNASEPIVAQGQRFPEMEQAEELEAIEGDASEAADVGTWRLAQALTVGR